MDGWTDGQKGSRRVFGMGKYDQNTVYLRNREMKEMKSLHFPPKEPAPTAGLFEMSYKGNHTYSFVVSSSVNTR